MREMRFDLPRAAPSGHAAAILENVFSIRAEQRPRAGLVQQTVQIVASHDLTFVGLCHATLKTKRLPQALTYLRMVAIEGECLPVASERSKRAIDGA